MKRLLLAAIILSLAVFASAYSVRAINQQITLETLDIMTYVTAPAGSHDANWHLSVTDGIDVVSTTTHLPIRCRVETKSGPTGLCAWAMVDMQAFTSTSGPSAGTEITWTLTYLPNTDEATNHIVFSFVIPTGTSAVWRHTGNGLHLVMPDSIILGGAPPQDPTYTVNLSTNPEGYITPTTLGPTTDVTTIYGTYTPTDVSATGYWTPASLTIDANTVWVADGYNFRFDQEFVWTELDYNNYHLTLNVVDTYFNGAYDINGYAVQAGTPTPIDALMVPALDPNPIDVDYTIAAAPDGYYWMPSVTQNPEFEMLQTKASKGVADYGDDLTWTLMQVNNYYRVIVQVWNGIDYNGVYDFTGPLNGSTPYVSTPITTYADYFGTYTMESPAPAGWHWEFTTYSGLDAVGDFAQDPNAPYLWTAYVTFNLIEEGPVPVELSSFTATLTGQNYVQLAWTSQSENQMMGYRVYRNTSADQANSALIDVPMIPATNTSTTQNYTVVDTDVQIGQMYYYWLEAVDYNASNFHGPVSVTVTGNVPPVLPEVTSMRNAYPNPFKTNGNTTIEVSLKAGDTGTLTIYNVQGQVVKTVSLTEGSHTINWNGRDSRGNACGSGIYFYKLSTQSMNQTKKMVIVK